MLHFAEGNTTRTVEFVKDERGEGYIWSGEQEIHEGPLEFETEDGRHREQVSITFTSKGRSGAPQGLHIMYLGRDFTDLTMEEAQALVRKWEE